MPNIDLNVFQAYATAHAGESHINVDTVQRWNASWLGFSFRAAAPATAETDQVAVQTFRDALAARYGAHVADAALNAAPATALSAQRILDAVTFADARQAEKTAAFARASAPAASPAEIARAMDFVMADVALPQGAHGVLLQAPLRDALQPLLAHVLALDATPAKTLLASLGAGLAARFENHLLRAMAQWDPAFDARAVSDIVAEIASYDELIARVPGLDVCLGLEATGFRGSVSTLLDRVQQDLPDLHARFGNGGHQPAGLTALRLTDSDPHKGGNRVAILALGDTRAVYKPRDVRIDEAISGSELASGRRSLMAQAGAQGITYRFLPRVAVDGTHYGYVQHLPHGTVADHLIDSTQAPAFHAQLGRAFAALMVAGARDIHHENMIVSGGLPHFSDLEFALSGRTFTPLAQALAAAAQPGGEAADAALRDALDRLMKGMQLEKIFELSTDTNSLLPTHHVHDNAFMPAPGLTDVVESVLAIRDATTGVITDNRNLRPLDARLADPLGRHMQPMTPAFSQTYAADVARGVRDGLAALQKAQNARNEYLDFVQNAGDFQVRHHPIQTSDQRLALGDLLQTGFSQRDLGDACDAFEGRLGNAQLDTLVQALDECDGEAKQALQRAMTQALGVLDVPYFSRVVNETSLRPDGAAPLAWDTPAGRSTDYFPQDLTAAPQAFATTLAGLTPATLARIESAVEQWMQLRGPSVSERYAIDSFAQYIDSPTLALIDALYADPRQAARFAP